MVDTDGDFIELYCEMMKDDMAKDRQAVQEWMEERDNLTVEVVADARTRTDYIIEGYSNRIDAVVAADQRSGEPARLQAMVAEVHEELAISARNRNRSSNPSPKANPCGKPKPSAS